ncbi:hypothetical protein DET49_111116 [Salegentibacter sp. 24]|uniref:hypothetical protein n=1 Tax=Salegentibacter sp. 24 TaxID=2183986 RepID=UPI00105F88E8|nr:hypothetical protein [Salegentibacter sp. 24]TDN87668.1 hypothetical protein DET49_111116 [Salegentibacter sp. 24]
MKKDFDSIQKIEFQEKSFKDLSDIIRQNIDELQAIENVNGKILKSSAQEFEAILVNRNQIKSESTLNLNILKESNSSRFINRIDTSGYSINITIKEENRTDENISFSLANDDYELYWLKNSPGYSIAYSQTETEKFTIKQISEEIWEDWLNKVGINFNI